MEKNSRQDRGYLKAQVAGQGVHGVQGLYRFRWRNRGHRACLHPGSHSLAEKDNETQVATCALRQHVLSQLLISSHPILAGHSLGQRGLYRGFF